MHNNYFMDAQDMKEELLKNIENPKVLEKLYRDNKETFKREFLFLYPQLTDHKLAEYWHERLNYEVAEISWGTNYELTFVIIASLISGLIAKIPVWTGVSEDFFYIRNIGFIVFPILTAYFAWKYKLNLRKVSIIAFLTLIALIFINCLPGNNRNDTLVLSCIHLPLFLWALLGYAFVGDEPKSYKKRLDFLRYNGDLIVITTLILIAGMLLTGITIGLFSIVGLGIRDFYFEYVVVFGLAASPIVGTYIIQTNPQLVSKVSPVIAKIFSPLVLITLVVYLIAILFSSKDPYNDRDFLIIFNGLLIGVMAIVLFSVSENSRSSSNQTGIIILFCLSVVTTIVNCIALSAILFRITEWGITPNRLAVLGGNVLILTNLIFVSYHLLKSIKQRERIEEVEKSISTFLPIYSLWTVMVIFIFPFLFSFK